MMISLYKIRDIYKEIVFLSYSDNLVIESKRSFSLLKNSNPKSFRMENVFKVWLMPVTWVD